MKVDPPRRETRRVGREGGTQQSFIPRGSVQSLTRLDTTFQRKGTPYIPCFSEMAVDVA